MNFKLPDFSMVPKKSTAQKALVIPDEVLNAHKQYIIDLDKEKNEKDGRLLYQDAASLKIGKKALALASESLKKFVSSRKERGSATFSLVFKRISKEEYEQAKATAEARGQKLKGRKRTAKKSK